MNTSTSNHIQQLLRDSGLLNSKVNPKNDFQNFDFSNETILITGAAGSVGSGLSKQLLHCNYKKLILVDIAESPLYELQQELEFNSITNIDFILLNITEKECLNYLFKTYKPTLIFHTAAYKHVPLMESNAYEAVKLNIVGTKLLADLAIEYKTKKFIFISTDKAVNPKSVMGITKRIAEQYLSGLNNQNETTFKITRFGNIFGSNGSVVPLFLNQINSGKPITVTDKEVSRYFICKHKACNLILKIATLNTFDSHLFTFNMGKPIKILDLANVLVSNFDDSTQIEITKIRPGEKLHEDIVSENETLEPTNYKDILLVKQKNKTEIKSLNFDELLKLTPYNSNSEIKAILKLYI